MSRFSRYARRPSPAAALAVVALVFALSGVAVALPGKGTVATKDIRKNAVTAAKIKNGAVVAAKLGAGSVGTAKIGAEAVTGAKVNEATLGKVPAAASADTAAKATSAEKAVSAEKATSADDALELEGRTLAQVRPLATGIKDETSQGLDDLTYETVMSTTITLPSGGATVVLNAGLELNNSGGAQAGGACRLKFTGSVVSSAVNVTMPSGHSEAIGLTAATSAAAGLRTAAVECLGSLADDTVAFNDGDLSVIALPTGG